MKIWLDDERPVPLGWWRCVTAWDCLLIINRNELEVVSLDHDLGHMAHGTGYDVLCWVERVVAEDRRFFIPLPQFLIHSRNPAVYSKMDAAIKSIGAVYEVGRTTE